jgi:hypothetical protein
MSHGVPGFEERRRRDAPAPKTPGKFAVGVDAQGRRYMTIDGVVAFTTTRDAMLSLAQLIIRQSLDLAEAINEVEKAQYPKGQ